MIDPLTPLYQPPAVSIGEVFPSVANPEAASWVAAIGLTIVAVTAIWACAALALAVSSFIDGVRTRRHAHHHSTASGIPSRS